MKSSFYPQQAARQAVIQAQESTHKKEINTLKQELEFARQQISSLQANNQNSISNSENEIAALKAENKKLHNIINQQKAQLDAMIQNSKNIESEDKSKIKELEKSLIEKTKDLTIKDGIIQGLQEAVKVISTANNPPMPKIKESSLNNSPIKKHDESSQNLQKTNLLLGIDDILTVKSQVVEDNPQSMLLGEMCNKSTIQVSEEDL